MNIMETIRTGLLASIIAVNYWDLSSPELPGWDAGLSIRTFPGWECNWDRFV